MLSSISRISLQNMKILPLLSLAFTLLSTNALEVNTPSGPIQGTTRTVNDIPVQAFLGIPYALPPVGELRFQEPVPIEPWTESLDATRLPPACMQYTIYPFTWNDDLPGKSEDCLYLNIYAPIDAKEGSNLAVLFWIHGGGWTLGSSRRDLYDASAIALLGNVIVVTINYRLGAFGFLFSNSTDAPGNVGMHDMYTALLWVNKNIESFGGDKDRITLLGESAGSISISMFCASPLAEGLFSKAIMESGSIIAKTVNQCKPNRKTSQMLAKAVGCASDDQTIESDPETVVNCLKDQKAEYLARAAWRLNPTSPVLFWPQFGDDLFPNNTLENIRNGNFHNIPLLIGNNLDEGSVLLSTRDPETFGFFGEKDTKFDKAYARQLIRQSFDEYDDPEPYIDYYLDSVKDDDYDAIRRQTYTAMGDNFFLCPTVYFAESYAEMMNDVYFYFFVHRPSITPWAPWMGVTNYEEVQFVSGQPIMKPQLYQPDEIELSKKMIGLWTNFAKYGVPTNSSYWPKYSKEEHDFVYLNASGEEYIYGTGPHLNNCNFFRSHFRF